MADLNFPPSRCLPSRRACRRSLHIVVSAAGLMLAFSGASLAAQTAPAAPIAPSAGSQPVATATTITPPPARTGYTDTGEVVPTGEWLSSPYIPMDSWMYPALLRLYSMGYLDTAYLSLRPWTRRSVIHMLDLSESDIRFDGNEQAEELLDKLYYELRDEPSSNALALKKRGLVYGISSAYAGARMVGGTVLRDSYHLGQTFNNDYGRPYSSGFNSYDGFSATGELGPFSLYFRGELQHAPAYEGYGLPLTQSLSSLDGINYNSGNLFGGLNAPQPTIPAGPVPAANRFRVLQATASAHVLGHEISFGKADSWLGPGVGGAMAWSNNAENMYAFRFNRVEPLRIPLVSRLLGDIRYDFMLGSLQGHTYPRHPYAHSEKIDFAPTKNFQLGFQRTIIFGGQGHSPVTLHTFLKGFFDINDTTTAEKYSTADPGARFSAFSFSYRLPFLRNIATLYADSVTHDDVFPISAPRRAAWRPGIYITRLPFMPKVDLRVEGAYTDYVTSRSVLGRGVYFEDIQRQGYTSNGNIMGDWMGREGKGGQAWVTYHLSGNETITAQYLRKKTSKSFIEGGTTQDIYRVDVIKRLKRDVELNAWFQEERWKAPIWKAGPQSSTTGAFQVTWYPKLKSGF